MRRQWLVWSVVAAWALPVLGQSTTPEARQWVIETLNGRRVVTRLYRDPRTSVEKFERFSVPITNGALQLNAISPDNFSKQDSVFLACSEDQTDNVVAAALDRLVVMTHYGQGSVPLVRHLTEPSADLGPWWTFVDALGKPMAGASVEVLIYANYDADDISLYKAKLDAQGRLKRRLGCTFSIRVEHPGYGVAMTGEPSGEDRSGVRVVPLLPHDSPEITASAQGNVVDNDGNPVAGVTLRCGQVTLPDGTRDDPARRIPAYALTDNQGRFSLCMPMASQELPPPGTQYSVMIEAPKASNLRLPEKSGSITLVAGSPRTITLVRMESREYFHTFSFESLEGPITDSQQLREIRLLLLRDGRPWRELSYEQWKDGCSLPLGTLLVNPKRSNRASVIFHEVVLSADSPEHIVVKARQPVIYRGRVVKADTEEPLSDAIVATTLPRSISDPCALTPEQWKMLWDLALSPAQDNRPEDAPSRATITDANGAYELVFMPDSYIDSSRFTALAVGYRPSSEQAVYSGPRLGEIEQAPVVVEVPVIRLSKLGAREYRPTFVFEDENGPVTDPNKLEKVKVQIRASEGTRTYGRSAANLFDRGRFIAGVYYAEVVWDRRCYTFAPVDLTEAQPATVTFRPQKIETADVIYAGRVVHGITGAPIAGAVILHRWGGLTRDVSCLTAEQWTAIRSLGSQINTTDPALAPLMDLLDGPRRSVESAIFCVTQTDSDGYFTLPTQIEIRGPTDQVLAVAPGFLGASQQLVDTISRGAGLSGPRLRRMFEPDANGIVTFQPMKLFPAATVRIRPVVPDSSGDQRTPSVRLYWTASPDAGATWLQDLRATAGKNQGPGILCQHDLQANVTQTLYVPAGVKIDLTLMVHQPPATPPPTHIGGLLLNQGEVVDLGRIGPSTGVQVAVKVVDTRGQPVSGVRISCVDESGDAWGGALPTNEAGVTTAQVALNSTGRFCAIYSDPAAQRRLEQCVPYAVAGPEDAGKEFTLQVSDDMVRLISSQKR